MSNMMIKELFDISCKVSSKIEQSVNGFWLDEAIKWCAKRIDLVEKDRSYKHDHWKLGREKAEACAQDDHFYSLQLTLLHL